MFIKLQCVPPSTTAQTKRLVMIGGKPRFFKSARMKAEEQTWWALLTPYTPDEPRRGPLSLEVVLAYPHLKKTPKRDRMKWLAKVTKPDVGNAVKHLEDVLVKLRFMEDDSQVSELIIRKFHVPDHEVGITINLLEHTIYPIID